MRKLLNEFMEKDIILNNIAGADKVFGKLCLEAENSYKNRNHFAALICLFVTAEQIVKHATDKNSGNYYNILIEAKKSKIINKKEFEILNNLRNLRNIVFHENNYSSGIEIKGIYFPFDEEETMSILYEKYSLNIFMLVEKILLKNVE
jgi:uncharacterized protein YutE (UPF0331/DUF86 family)